MLLFAVQGTPPNAVQKAVFCALHCCLKCVECCMDKVNKNALIWQAVYGDSFGTACCSSFALVWRNLARVAALHVVSWLIVDLGKFAVALLTSGLFSYLIQKSGEISELSELGLPIFLVFCISLGVASMFFMIFQSVSSVQLGLFSMPIHIPRALICAYLCLDRFITCLQA